MKIEIKGSLKDRWSKKITKKNGENMIIVTIIVKIGENEYGEKLIGFQAFKEEKIELIKKLNIGDEISCSGYLGTNIGENEKGKWAMTNINLTYIAKNELKQKTNTVAVQENDNLPF